MRWFLKLAMVMVIVAGLSAYAAYLRTGRLPWQLFKLPAGVHLAVPDVPKLSAVSDRAEKQRIYKWRDADGVLHFTTDPPPKGVSAEVVTVDPNANVITAPAQPPADAGEETQPAPGKQAQGGQTDGDAPPLYSPSGIKKLFNGAKQARDQMNQRTRDQQKALNGL